MSGDLFQGAASVPPKRAEPRAIACPLCAASLAPGARMTGGRYSFGCVGCCARLVLSAWGMPGLIEANLAAVDRWGDGPPRERVLRLADRLRHGRTGADSAPRSGTLPSDTAASR